MGSGSLVLVRPASAEPVAGTSPGAGAAEQRLRIVDATLACIARFGLAKTTLDDVARAAGYSRATVYRAFPGGKEALLSAVVETELARLFSDLAVAMGEAGDIEDVLVAGMAGAARRISGHAALGYLLAHEPEVVLPHLAFDHHDRLLAHVAAYAAPFLGRWVAHDEALRVAEWAARIVLSHLGCPDVGVDLTDDACVRRLVRRYVLPGVRVLSASADEAAVGTPPRVPVNPPVSQPELARSKGEAS